MLDKTYKHYLRDLIQIVLDTAIEAKKIRDQYEAGTQDFFMESGRVLAFNEVIRIMQQQATAFQIPKDELGLSNIDPDRDLI